MTHIPTPWINEGSLVYAPGDRGGTICVVSELRKSNLVEYANLAHNSKDIVEAYDNAAYIVKCVNCHDELDAALKLAGDYLANGDLSDLSIRDGVLAAITAARISGRL